MSKIYGNCRRVSVYSFPMETDDINTVDLGCNEINGSELTFRYNQGFVTDKVLYNMYNKLQHDLKCCVKDS